MTKRPTPDKNGMIPCTCCRRGYRVNMHTKEKRLCEFCKGTTSRKAPEGYQDQAAFDAAVAKYEEYEEQCI